MGNSISRYWLESSWLQRALAAATLVIAVCTPVFAAETFPLPMPTDAAFVSKIAAIEKEVARLRESGKASQADALNTQLQEFLNRVAGKTSSREPELHVVGVYKGEFLDGPRKYGTAAVEVRITGRPIVLALTAYDSVRWSLKLTEGVQIQKIILSGYYDQELIDPPAGVPVEKYTYEAKSPNYFYAFDRNSAEFGKARTTLKKLTGLEIRAILGASAYKGTPFVLGNENPEWRLQQIAPELDGLYRQATAMERATQRQSLAGIQFTAVQWIPNQAGPRLTSRSRLSTFTIAGPIEDPNGVKGGIIQVAVDPRGPTYYAIDNHRLLLIDPATGKGTELAIEGDLPRLSWAGGVAWDSKRNRLWLSSMWHVGDRYLFEPDTKKWSLLPGYLPVWSLTYSPDDDCIFGLARILAGGNGQGVKIYKFAPTGELLDTLVVPLRLSSATPEEILSPNQLVSVGKQLILLAPPVNAGGELGRMTVHVIDPRKRNVTYSGEMRSGITLKEMAAGEIDRLWKDVANAEPGASGEIITKLAAGGDPVVKYLHDRAQPAPKPDPARFAQLVSRLDAADFKERQAAFEELSGIADLVSDDLRSALTKGVSVEAATSLQAILGDAEKRRAAADDAAKSEVFVRNPAQRSILRTIRVLELIGTPAAVDYLNELAAGSPDITGTAEARAALRRI